MTDKKMMDDIELKEEAPKEKVLTLYDTTPSLYAQYARAVLSHTKVKYTSQLVSMPDQEHLQPWYAKINPKMEIPALKVVTGSEQEIICGSREIAEYAVRVASQEIQDEIYPNRDMRQCQEIDEVIDLLYSVDIADVSFQLGKLTSKPIAMAMERGPKKMTEILTKLAAENPDLKEVYEAKKAKSTKHQDKSLEDYKAEVQVVIEKLSEKLGQTKYLAAETVTLADIMASVFIQWAVWNNKLLPGTHIIPANVNNWFKEIQFKMFFSMTYNRPKPHFVIDQFKGIIKKKIGMACALFTLLVAVIVVIIVVLTRGGMSSKTDIMNSTGLTGVAGTIFIQQRGEDKSMITGRITGLNEGNHALYISKGAPILTGNCNTAGGIYKDIGVIVANAQGFAPINIESTEVFIDDRATSVMGKFFVITENVPLVTSKAADAVFAIACGTIKKGPPPPKRGKGGGPPGRGRKGD